VARGNYSTSERVDAGNIGQAEAIQGIRGALVLLGNVKQSKGGKQCSSISTLN